MRDHEHRPTYVCGDWEIDLSRHELRFRGVSTDLGGRAFEILEVLVRSAGELVDKYDLMRHVWPGAVVDENTLQAQISTLRKRLAHDRELLQTVVGRGYRLRGKWTIRDDEILSDPAHLTRPSTEAQKTIDNLPTSTTALVGRGIETKLLLDLLSTQRMVTLTGPGGIGKTALALEVARTATKRFEDGVWFADLSSISDSERVPSKVAETLGVTLSENENHLLSIARALSGQTLLLILDNCEHVIDAAASLVDSLVRSCPSLTILSTSRELLGNDGEYVYDVPPLSVPAASQEEPSEILEHGAVRLFVAKTKMAGTDVPIHRENALAISAICREVDGIPLAIEFAASRAAALGIQVVASHLHDHFGLLKQTRRSTFARHQTLQAALDWSYDLLPSFEKCLVRRLAIFAGGFTTEAATAVMKDVGSPQSRVMESIGRLVEKSLVTRPHASIVRQSPQNRWRLLEPVRAHALEKLNESAETDLVARYHAEFFRELFLEPALVIEEQRQPTPVDVARFIYEIDNVREALDWSLSPSGDLVVGAELAAAAGHYFLALSLLTECYYWATRAVSAGPPTIAGNRCELALQYSIGVSLMFTSAETDEVEAALTRGLEIAERLSDPRSELRLLSALHIYKTRVSDFHGALEISERCIDLARTIGSPASVRMAEWMAGTAHHLLGNQIEACNLCQSAMIDVPGPDWSVIGFGYDRRILALVARAEALWLAGFPDQAVQLARRTLEEAEAVGNPWTLSVVMMYTAFVFLWAGDLDTAQNVVANLIDNATKHSLNPYRAVGLSLKGALSVKLGEPSMGIELLQEGLRSVDRVRLLDVLVMSMLAEGFAEIGRFDEALSVIEQAMARISETGESFAIPEAIRVRGEILRLLHRPSWETEECFQRSVSKAREQRSLSWELRTTMSLARLWLSQNRRSDAAALLRSVIDRFEEGFESFDVRVAQKMLDGFSERPAGHQSS